MRKMWLGMLVALAIVLAAGGCARKAADAGVDTSEGESREATPVASIEPSAAIGMTVAEAAAKLKSRGNVYVFTNTEHGIPASEYSRSREATVVGVSVREEGTDVALRVGAPVKTPPWILYKPGVWGFPHVEAVKKEGTERCFECHAEMYCSYCHTRVHGKPDVHAPEGAKRIADIEAAASLALAGDASSSRIADVVWTSEGYTLVLERSGAPKNERVLWAEAASVLGAQQTRNLWLENLRFEWTQKGDARVRARLEVELYGVNWERVPASEVPGLAKSAKYAW